MTFLLPPGINGLIYIALHSQWKQKSFRRMLFPLKAVCSRTEWKMIRYNGNIVLVCKRTLSHLAKLSRRSVSLNVLSVYLWTKCLWVRIPLQPLKFKISCLFWARVPTNFRGKIHSVHIRDMKETHSSSYYFKTVFYIAPAKIISTVN